MFIGPRELMVLIVETAMTLSTPLFLLLSFFAEGFFRLEMSSRVFGNVDFPQLGGRRPCLGGLRSVGKAQLVRFGL